MKLFDTVHTPGVDDSLYHLSQTLDTVAFICILTGNFKTDILHDYDIAHLLQ